VWFVLMLVILLTNGMSSFGLKVLQAWGLPSSSKYVYLTIWYAAGFACIGAPMLGKGLKLGLKEIRWGAILAALSIGGQLAMASALQQGLPGNVVFPVTLGGSILIVALASRVLFAEKMHPLSWAGMAVGCVAVVLLSVS